MTWTFEGLMHNLIFRFPSVALRLVDRSEVRDLPTQYIRAYLVKATGEQEALRTLRGAIASEGATVDAIGGWQELRVWQWPIRHAVRCALAPPRSIIWKSGRIFFPSTNEEG